jgi:KDO2-lipid IV(A) lauroyltransferase
VLFLAASMIFAVPVAAKLTALAVFAGFAAYALLTPWRKYPVERKRSWIKRWLKHPAEALIFHSVAWFFRLLPLEWTSWIIGRIMEIVGPRMKRHKVMRKNLAEIMPENCNKKFMRKVWNNWGRVYGEGFHFRTYARNEGKCITFRNMELLQTARNNAEPFIVCVPHMGYMGLASIVFAKISERACGITYRFPNNPLTNDVLMENYGQQSSGGTKYLPIGNSLLTARILAANGAVAINPDHRFKGGEQILFFGKPAKTSTGVARLAQKFGASVLVLHVRRVKGARHEIVFDELMRIPSTGDAAKDELNGMQIVNDAIERAVRQSPDEYLWMHGRWD